MKNIPLTLCLIMLLSFCGFSVQAEGIDADAQKAFAKENNCLRCHGTDKDKEGTGFNTIAKKYKGNAKAKEILYTHLTSGKEVEFKDKHKEAHKKLDDKTDADKAAINNLVDWILSL